MTDEKWIPANAPDLKGDFDKSRNQPAETKDNSYLSPAQQEYQKFIDNRAQKTADELLKEREEKRPIATKSKLEKLLAEREQPKRTLDLTIGGTIEKFVHQDISKERKRENEIRQLVERLAPNQNKARDDFNIKADGYMDEKTKAMQDFEKEWDRDR
jgi:hypothetical protein